jgi:hypothetical protein
MLEPKHGGNVIEVDVVIKLATTDELSKQIEEKMASIPPHTEEQIAEQKRRERYLIENHMPPEEREVQEGERREVGGDLEGRLEGNIVAGEFMCNTPICLLACQAQKFALVEANSNLFCYREVYKYLRIDRFQLRDNEFRATAVFNVNPGHLSPIEAALWSSDAPKIRIGIVTGSRKEQPCRILKAL